MQRNNYSWLLAAAVLLTACSLPKNAFKDRWLKQKAPDNFVVKMETTKGVILMESKRSYSPAAVDRFYQLVKHGYFTNIPVYRVVPDFVAQFGSLDTAANKPWQAQEIADEPVVLSNVKGTVSFARAGKNTRGTQLYINLKDNVRLDTSGTGQGVPGFPGIATVTQGMDAALALYAYGDSPRQSLRPGMNQDSLFNTKFPLLDYIQKASLVKKGRK